MSRRKVILDLFSGSGSASQPFLDKGWKVYRYDIEPQGADGIFIDKDIYLMGFHPETEANDLLDDSEFETELDALYGMIFIQRFSLLCNASEKLMSKGYYERNHGNYDVQAILAKRKELYGRLKSG